MTDATPAQLHAPLPRPLSSFVGRERDLGRIRALFQQPGVRLITLTGPGGVGKTRLAVRIAHDLQHTFADGVAFVPLAPITDCGLVCATVARALGLRERSDLPPEALLAEALRNRHLLLVLDNFEQIVDAAPQLSGLLSACPDVRILVTSRIVLRLTGEHTVPVEPLLLPQGSAPLSEQAAADAVRLFADRARAVDPSFTVTADNIQAVVAICHRLDGLPLALELVAAKVRVLPPQALLPRLATALPLLAGGRRDDPVRLQTMRSAIAWSYDLLTPEEQRLFQRLSVFAGGFTLDAAEVIGGDHAAQRDDVLQGIEALAEQSLIRRVEVSGTDHEAAGARFVMLETVREFAGDRLAQGDEADAVRAAHAGYFLALAEQAESAVVGPAQARWFTRLDAELPNARAAMAWLQATGQIQLGLRMASHLGWYWFRRNREREGYERLRAFLSAYELDDALRAQGLTTAATLAVRLGRHEEAAAWSEQALAIAQSMGDQRGVAVALRSLGDAVAGLGDLARADALLSESREMFQVLHAPWDAALALHWLGIVTFAWEDYDTAIRQFTQARDLYREAGDRVFENWMRGNIGWVSLISGNEEHARAAFSESLAVAWAQGDTWWVAWCLMGAGGLASRRGDTTVAAHLFGKADALRTAAGAPLRPSVQAKYDLLTSQSRARLGEPAWSEAFAAGAELSVDHAVDAARGVLSALPSPVERAREHGERFGLTSREAEVLRLVAAGSSNAEIAAALFISVPTVKRHVSTILGKLDLPSRPAVVAFAHTHGLA